MTFAAAEADRRIGNVLSLGQVIEVDSAAGRARVQIGALVTPMIPVMQIRSGAIKLHWMPSAGEQVTVAAPSGDFARAWIMGSLPTDGHMVAPDAATPTMDLGGGTLRVVGDLEVQGSIRATGDVLAAGVSLRTHTHGGVLSGGARTGGPG